MDIKDELLKEHSKRQTLKIASYIGNDTNRFADLMSVFVTGPYRVTQRASWVLSHCAEAYPYLVTPYLEKLIDNLDHEQHDAVKRNTVRLLQFIDIPEDLLGKAADHCFRLLADKTEPVAVRVFSMAVLGNICSKEPALKRELRLLIEEELPYGSAAFLSRAKNILKSL